MSRWEPNARGRLEQAALELFGERGFEQTTVAEIAERAGLTKRTFFRHFADKREVLFGGGDELQELFVSGLADAPAVRGADRRGRRRASRPPAPCFEERRELARRRQAVIAANAELQERELVKLASLAAALAAALRERGVARAGREPDRRGRASPSSGSRSSAGSPDAEPPDLPALIRESLAELRAVAA